MVIKYSLKISLRKKWTDGRTDGGRGRQAKLYASNSAVACISGLPYRTSASVVKGVGGVKMPQNCGQTICNFRGVEKEEGMK